MFKKINEVTTRAYLSATGIVTNAVGAVARKAKSEEGLTILEYILLGSLVLIIAIVFYNLVRPASDGASQRIVDTLNTGVGQAAQP